MTSLLIRFLPAFFLCLTATAKTVATPDTIFTDLPVAEYAVTAQSLPLYARQIKLGTTYPTTVTPRVRLEYPEYCRLTAEEVRLVKLHADAVTDSIVPNVSVGVSRKQALLDVSFCPIVRHGGRYVRLVSFKLVVDLPESSPIRAKSGIERTTDSRWKSHSVLAEGKWVKIRVGSEGIYRLTASALSGMGFSDISRVKLYGYGGRPQPEDWDFSTADRIPDDLNEVPLYRKDNAVMFFAEGTVRWDEKIHTTNPYSSYSYYFLTEGDAPLEFPTLTATEAATREVTSIMHNVVLDNDAATFYAGGRELYDSYDYSGGATHTFSLDAPGAGTTQQATVTIAFAASSNTSSTRVSTVMNGSRDLGSFVVNAYGSDEIGCEGRRVFTVPAEAVQATNTFRISTPSAVTARLNFIRLNYERRLSADCSPYAFSPTVNGAATLSVADATGSTRVWRLGNADNTVAEVAGTLDGSTYSAVVDNASARFVIVNTDMAYPAPEVVGSIDNQDLHADSQADMVIIIPESGRLREQAERLAEAHREKQGLRINIVSAGQLYNEFSSGTPDASAYRRYLKMLYDRATTTADLPRYLLLFGDCAWDNRMITADWRGDDPKDYLLAFEVNNGAGSEANGSTSYNFSFGDLSSYVTDDFFGWLDDNEGTAYHRNKLDLAIGRFPCTDATTAAILVDKTIAYMNNDAHGAWKNKVYVLGDDIDNNLHMEGAEDVAESIADASGNNLLVHRVYWDAYPRVYTATGYNYPQATRDLQQYLRRGALIFNYVGHGSPDQISHACVLTKSDFTLGSEGRLPLWIMASCKIAPYDDQTEDIGRNALYNRTGGAVAVLSASRSVYAYYNVSLNTSYCRYLLENSGATCAMGDALRESKVAMVNGQDGTINKLKYALLGDPALFIGMPRTRVVLDSINGQALTNGSFVGLKAGSTARFSGRVTDAAGNDANDFTGYVSAIVSDRLETITCRNNSNGNSAMVYTDRSKSIFEGSDSIANGRFAITISIPRDISYTNDAARITLYAVSNDHTREANGYNEQFYLNGTDESLEPDTINPTVWAYLDDPDFVSGGITSANPVFMADISDDAGINAAGISVGHDMELTIDGDAANSHVLNDYFTYDFGSYRSGSITYPLTDLADGAHTLTFKAWDVNNNATTVRLDFHVNRDVSTGFDVNVTQNPARTTTNFVTRLEAADPDGTAVTIEVFDIAGRRVWSSQSTITSTYDVRAWQLTDQSGAALPSGLYLYRSTARGAGGEQTTDAKKIIIIKQ